MELASFKEMCRTVFEELNGYIEKRRDEMELSGGMGLGIQTIKIVGQTALFFGELPFSVTASMDLDVISKIDHGVAKKLDSLLTENGLRLESDGHLIWMPPDTRYTLVFDLPYVKVFVADVDSVMCAKYKFNRLKDKKLIEFYLNYFPEKKETLKLRSKK